MKSSNNSGFTLTELVCSVLLIGTLSAIAIPTMMRLIGNVKVSMAITELTLHGGKSRYDSIGESSPNTLCAKNDKNGILYQNITGTDCDSVTSWQSISNVKIDTKNSTLRTVRGVAGNSGGKDPIYRLSFADTDAGYGASYGQLGKLVIQHPWTPKQKCLVLSHVNGRNDIREDNKCLKK